MTKYYFVRDSFTRRAIRTACYMTLAAVAICCLFGIGASVSAVWP